MSRAVRNVRSSFVLACLSLAAFLGGSPPAAAYTLNGAVIKGPVSGATVRIYLLAANGSTGKLLGTRLTDGAGGFTLKLTKAPAVPVLVESAGGSYTDEVTGDTVTLTAADLLTAIVPVRRTTAIVTPLTHLAAVRARALALSGVRIATAADAAAAGLARQYHLRNLGETRPVAADDPVAVLTATREQRNYGLVLAGLSQLALSLDVRTADLVAALAADLSDGTLDGAVNLVPIDVPTLGGSTVALGDAGTAGLQAAIEAFAASARNKTALAEKSIGLEPVNVGINGAGLFYTTTTVLPAWISGRSGTARLTAKGGRPPYRCTLAAGSILPPGFALAANCVLTGIAETLAPGTTMKITPPFSVIMRDSAIPPSSVTLQLRVTIIAPGPTFKPVDGRCYKGIPCKTQVADATGGTPPYYFTSSSFATGAPPLGTFVGLGGFLVGTTSRTGKFPFGVTVVDVVGATASGKTRVKVVAPPTFTLRVTKSGNGAGTVTSSPAGIACGSDCANNYVLATEVTLTAVPRDAGQAFTGWSGDCSGTADCVLTMDQARQVNAEFKTCANHDESCDSTPCCGAGKCAPNPGCPGSDPTAINTCYGPCGGDYPHDCGNKCCGTGFPVCGAGCWCWQW